MSEVVVAPTTIRFNQMNWPRAGESAGGLQHKLRYSPERITREDQLYAASIISAYQALVLEKTQVQRNEICKHLKKVEVDASICAAVKQFKRIVRAEQFIRKRVNEGSQE